MSVRGQAGELLSHLGIMDERLALLGAGGQAAGRRVLQAFDHGLAERQPGGGVNTADDAKTAPTVLPHPFLPTMTVKGL